MRRDESSLAPNNNDDTAAIDASPQGPSYLWVGIKCLAAMALIGAGLQQWNSNNTSTAASSLDDFSSHRRLTESSRSYLEPLWKELEERKKLFAEAEVVKYWFEYTGPLQVRTYITIVLRHFLLLLSLGKDERWTKLCIVHLKYKVTLCLMNTQSIRQKPYRIP